MSRMPTDGIDALYDQLAGGQAAADPVDALYDQLAGPQAAPSRGLLGRAEDTAASFTAGLAGGIPQAVGQFARLGQATQYAAANPLRTGALAASSAARFAMDPASAIAGTPSMAQQVGQYMDSAADAIPRMPLTPSQQLVAQGAGGIADTAGLVGRSALSVAPAAASVPFSPESIAMNVGQTLPMQAASMGAAALGGQPGAFASSMLFESASIVDESYNRLKEANPKMTDQDALERAFLPSVLAAIPAAALDAGTGGEAAVARGVKKQAESAAKSLARRVLASGKEIGRSAIEEALTEPIQGLIEDVGSAVAQPSTAQMQPGDVHAMLVKRGTEALVGGLMGGVGAATVAIPNAAQEPMAPAVAPQQAPQVAAPQPVQAPAQPVDPRVEAVQQSAADRLAGKQAPATPEPGELLRSLGVERQPDQAALEQQQPPAGRQASTLADLLRDETIKPETRKSLADRYAAGEITRDELAAMLEAQIEASPEEKVRREFEAMAAKGSESAPPAAPEPVASEPPKIDQPAQEGVQEGAGPVGGALQAEQAIQPEEAAQAPAPSTQTAAAESPAPTLDFAAEVRKLQDERDETYPAGDALSKVAKQSTTESLVSLYKWTQTQHSEVNRWLGGAAAAELRSRGVALSNEDVQRAPSPTVVPRTVDRYSGRAIPSESSAPQKTGKASGGQTGERGNAYAGAKSILLGGMAAGDRMRRAQEIHEASDRPDIKDRAEDIYSRLNRGVLPPSEADALLDALENDSREPQRQGAEPVAPQAKEPTNGNPVQEGQQEGRPEGLLNQQTPAVSENTPAPAAGVDSAEPQASVDDIDANLATAAFSGSSFVPEKRGLQWRQDYVAAFNAARDRVMAVAKTPEQKAQARIELARFKEGLAERFRAFFASSSRVVSTMIAGPSNFPVQRMEKYGNWAHKKLTELVEYRKRAETAMLRRIAPGDSGVIRSDQANAVESLRTKIEEAKRLQEAMKTGNKIVRDKNLSRDEKLAKLKALGLRESTAIRALENVPGQGVGFPSYALQNNLANIKRMEDRVAELTRLRSSAARTATFDGGRIEEDKDDTRVRIYFDAKPNESVREKLKRSGFRWSPTAGAWQRLANEAGWRAAVSVTGAVQTPEVSEQVDGSPELTDAQKALLAETTQDFGQEAPSPAPAPAPQTPAAERAAETEPSQDVPKEWLKRSRIGKQWATFKAKRPDAALAFRVGDFYEFFGPDAVAASKAAGLTLTRKSDGLAMAGIPANRLEEYLKKLIAAGVRVAVVEEVSNKEKTAGVIERVVTPGAMVEESEPSSPQVSELRERRALRFNGERWQYRVSPTSGWTSALSKDAAIEAATRSLQDQAVPKFPTAASRLRDGLGPIDASEIESEWNNVVRQVENEREDSVVRRANAAAAALDGLPAKFRDRIAGEFRDQYPHIVEYMTSRKMTPIDVAASLQNNQPSQEPANAPEPQPEQPAPEPTASTPMEGPEGLGSDPTDHGGVTWDSAANQLERDQANVKSLEQEKARLNKLPDSQGWQTPTSIQLAKIRNELRTLQVKLKTREKTVEQAAKLRKAIGDGQVTDEKRAREIVSAANAAPLLGLQNIPAAGLRAIRTAERMLLKPVDVDAGAGTTLYVWSEAWGDEGFDDRVKQAKSLAAKMKKEEAAAARELARIDKQGAMVTPAGKVVARPSPKETESTTDKPRTVKVFKTDQERLAGISVATARETSRYAINGVNVSKGGTEVAATDGRRLLIHVRPEGFGVKDGLYLDGNGNDIAKGVLTKPGTKDDGQFPPYGDIIPRLDTVKPVGAFDPLELLSMARKAQVMTSEQSNGVIFMVGSEETPKGQTRTVAGMYANAADVGEVWVGRGRAEAVFCINPQFLIESLEWHAKNGSPIVSIYNESPRKPIVIVGADGTTSVIMPINAPGNAPESAVDPRPPIAPPSLRESETAGSRSAYETILKSAAGDRPAVSAKGKRGNPKRRSFAEMADQTIGVLDRIASSARERMRQREAQGVRLYSNPFLAPEFYSDMRDIALVAAAEAFKAGIKGGRKLTAIVEKAIADHRPALQERAAEVRRVAAKMLRAANGDPDRFEQVANTVVNQPPRTRAEARAARKAKVEARKAAANAKPPAEAPTVTATDAMKASLKAAEKAANKVQKQAVTAIKRSIVRSYRNGVEAGVARAKAKFMPIVRSLREAAKRGRAMSGIEMRGVADAAAAKQAEVDAIRTTIRKLAQDLPPSIRGKFLTAVEQGTTPLKLARAVRDMHRALSRWEATQFARRIGKWTTKKRLARLDNARRRAVRMMAAVAGTDWATVKAKGTDANAMRAAADRLRDTYEAIRQQYAEHYAENKRIKALREQTAKEAAEEAADNIMRAKKPMPAPEGRKDVRTHPMVRLAQGAMDLLNALQSVEGKFDGSGVLERVVYQPMLRAEDKFFSELRNRTKQIEQAVRRAGFGGLRQAFEALSPMGGKAAERTIDVVLGGKTQTISLGQAISLAAIDSQTEELIDAGMKVQMRDGRFREPIVVTMKEVQAIRQRLASTEPKLLRMVSELKGIMEEMRPGVFRVHRILKGFEPEIVPDRWPRVRNLSAGEKTQALPESSHELVNRVLENSGFLKERTGGTDAPMLVDHVLNVIFDQVEQSSKVMHLAIPVRDAAGVLLDSRVRVAVSDRWGGDLYTKLKQMLMAASRANQVLNTKGARTVHAINSALAIRYLATNVGTYGRQVAGAARLIPYFSAKDWAHGVANAHKVSVEDMANKSGYFWDRYIGNAAGRMSAVMSDEAADRTQPAAIAAQRLALRNLMKRDLHAAYRAQLNVGRAILQTVNFFDGLVARTAWAAAENQARREHPEWSDAKRNRWVADRAAEVIRDTQNGSSPMDLAINAALNRDSGMAAWFLFTSDMYKARNRIARAFKRSAEDGMKMVAAEAASIVIGTALARAAGWGAGRLIASAFGADDKDKRKIDEYYWMPERMAWDVAKQIVPVVHPLAPLVGQPITDILQGARGGGFTPPALEAINQIYQSVANAANAAKKGDAEKFIKRLGKVVYEVGSTAGLNPFGWLLDKVMREIQKDSPPSGRMGGLKSRL